ncbi:site-specific integrase [Brevibacillus gelatini]|uniref:site-specific integrase n=1 Tax=Brevibacillus gelatini TaxID=1655277 RepID=UPI003D816103
MVSRNKSFSMVCTSSMVRQSFANSLIVMSLLSCINDHLLNGKFNHLHKTFYALKNSKRKVALPPSVLAELRDYYIYRMKERDMIGDRWQGGEYFFVFSHADGKAFHHESPYLWFRQFIKKNGFRYIRFHDLRHTSATLLINQGVHAKLISERLGHGSITTTMNIYGHALRSADQSAAEKFENLLTFDATKHTSKKTVTAGI